MATVILYWLPYCATLWQAAARQETWSHCCRMCAGRCGKHSVQTTPFNLVKFSCGTRAAEQLPPCLFIFSLCLFMSPIYLFIFPLSHFPHLPPCLDTASHCCQQAPRNMCLLQYSS